MLRLARWDEKYFEDNKIMTKTQMNRMKNVELVGELMASIHAGGLINKKSALDRIISSLTPDGRALKKCSDKYKRTSNLMKRIFTNLKSTRFRNSAEFYSLFMLIWQMDEESLILNDKLRNCQAQALLVEFSKGVDAVREKTKKIQAANPDQQLFVDYLLTIQGGTDTKSNRQQRAEILTGVIGKLFDKRDTKRNFSIEQRRLIWHTSESKKCVKCGLELTWDNFTIDHIKAYARGGKTSPKNAQLMCGSCNSRKGKR
jgi:hypothetical protein